MNVVTEQRALQVGDILHPSPELPPGSIVQRVDPARTIESGGSYLPDVFVRAYGDTTDDPCYRGDSWHTWAEVLADGPVTVVYIPGQDAPAETDPAETDPAQRALRAAVFAAGQDRAAEWLLDHGHHDAAVALDRAIGEAPDGLL